MLKKYISKLEFQINSRTHPKEYGGRGSAQNTAKKAKLKVIKP